MTNLGRVVLAALALGALPLAARADVRSEMIADMTKLGDGAPDAVSVVDWDNFTFHAPQFTGMDVHKMYSQMDSANKKAFRESFVKSFAQSYKQSSGGHRFEEVARVPGALKVNQASDHPSLVLTSSPSNPGGIRIGYVRRNGHLLVQSIDVLAKPKAH